MANWSYLDAYTGSLPAAQRQRLLDLLYADIKTETIGNITDYEAQLNKQLEKIAGKLPAPKFKLRKTNEKGITNSYNYNDMETNAISDLGLLYKEAVLLSEASSNHSNLLIGKLESIESVLGRLEKEVDSLEVLASNTEGFVTSVFNSFEEGSTNRLERYQSPSISPFTIAIVGFISNEYDAVTEGGSLRLPVSNTISYRLEAASLENQTPEASGVISTSEDTPTEDREYGLAKLIDANTSTYWAETVTIPTLTAQSATADLVVLLAGVQQLTRIVVEPFTRFPYKITGIRYKENRASVQEFDVYDDPAERFPIWVSGKTIIEFPTIAADQIRISIEQPNYSRLRYVVPNTNNTVTELFDLATGQQLDISPELEEVDSVYFAMTRNMRNLLNINRDKLMDITTVDTFEFLYGLKSLAVAQLNYKSQGIFVSKTYDIPLAGGIGLEVDQTSPSDLVSVEFDVLAEYRDAGEYVDNFESPILPADISVVTGEILDGEEEDYNTRWVATTRFRVDEAEEIVVYQNGTIMLDSAYSKSFSDGYLTIEIDSTKVSYASRKVSFFSIDYTPQESAYTVGLERHDNTLVNLRIFLRSKDPNKQLSPVINSYSMKFKKFSGA